LNSINKAIRQIAEIVHMGLNDISDVIKKYTGEENDSINKARQKILELLNHLQGKVAKQILIQHNTLP
jgi:hypothetical protein